MSEKKKRTAVTCNPDHVIENATTVLNKIAATMDKAKENYSVTKKSQSEVFGEFVVGQLSLIEPDEELFLDTQQAISEILYNARKSVIYKE